MDGRITLKIGERKKSIMYSHVKIVEQKPGQKAARWKFKTKTLPLADFSLHKICNDTSGVFINQMFKLLLPSVNPFTPKI